MNLVRSLRTKLRKRNRKRSQRGQGITEYGAMLAFVAILVACVFGVQSALKSGVSGAYSSMAGQLNNLSAASSGAS